MTVKTLLRNGWAAAVLSGLFLYLCFPPAGWGFLAPLAPVPLLAALSTRTMRARRSAALGCVSFLVFFLLLLRWLLHLDETALPHPEIRPPIWFLASAYLSVFGAAFALLAWLLGRLWRMSPLLFAPLVWVASEFVRGLGDLGFTWGQLCYAVAPYPVAVRIASLGGASMVSLAAITLSALLTVLLRRRRRWAMLAVVALVALVAGYGLLFSIPRNDQRQIKVALIQPNISSESKSQKNRLHSNISRLARLTARAADETIDLVVWPETAALTDLTVHSYATERIRKIARNTGSPLLVGFPRLENGQARNSAALLSPQGELLDVYDKIQPVPFSERMPLGSVFAWVNRLDLGQSSFGAGSRHTVFDLPNARFGVLICFESTFSRLARGLVSRGAEFLVVITNDAWFGKRAGSAEQHAWMSVLRAAETGVPVIRCGNTGISMIIDPGGRAVSGIPPWTETILTDTIQARPGQTLYLRWGDWVAYACLLATGVLLLGGAIKSVARPRVRET